jgi:hypothetical protein
MSHEINRRRFLEKSKVVAAGVALVGIPGLAGFAEFFAACSSSGNVHVPKPEISPVMQYPSGITKEMVAARNRPVGNKGDYADLPVSAIDYLNRFQTNDPTGYPVRFTDDVLIVKDVVNDPQHSTDPVKFFYLYPKLFAPKTASEVQQALREDQAFTEYRVNAVDFATNNPSVLDGRVQAGQVRSLKGLYGRLVYTGGEKGNESLKGNYTFVIQAYD